MTKTNETTDAPDVWEVVAVCTDESVTDPYGTHVTVTSAERQKQQLQRAIADASRFVDHYEVRRIAERWYSCTQCEWSGERCARDDHYPVCPDCSAIVDVISD